MKTAETPKLSFVQQYDLEQRRKMAANTEKMYRFLLFRRANSVLVVIEKNHSCHLYPKLTTNLFITNLDRTLYTIEKELKKRLEKPVERSL